MTAKYLAFEGIDGSGKTKQLSLLYNYLTAQNYSVLLTREFGSEHDSACVKIRDFALNSLHNIDEYAGQFMFAACSSQHNEKVIKPNLDKYDFILSDRSVESNLAYCAAIEGFSREFAHQLFFSDSRRINPDHIIFLNTDPDLCWQRLSRRTQEKFTDGGVDRIEDKGKDFQKRVYTEYQHRIKYSTNYIVINSTTLTIDETHQTIRAQLGL